MQWETFPWASWEVCLASQPSVRTSVTQLVRELRRSDPTSEFRLEIAERIRIVSEPISEMESISINTTAARWVAGQGMTDRRVRRRRSARCEKRGVRSNQEFGVAKLGTDGPARRSSLLSPAWWTGPPPIPRRGPPRATNRMTRPPRRSPPQEAARGFWIRAWGQREPALQGTGRSNDPARWLGLLEGGLDDPRHSRQMPTHFASNTRSGR